MNGTSIFIFPQIAILDFFSCVGYLHPKLHIKGVKSPFLNFVGYMKHRLLLEGLLHSVTKAPYFSKKPIITKFSKLKSFTLIWSRVFKKDKYHFLFHFSKHSIYTKVVLSSPNLTDINQDTKNDLFSIVFFVFNKALVPFVQIWAARKIIL